MENKTKKKYKFKGIRDTRAVEPEVLQQIVKLAYSGFDYVGDDNKSHRFYRNDRTALVIQVMYETCLRGNDVLHLKLSDFIYDVRDKHYRLNSFKEKKTGKIKDNVVSTSLVEKLIKYSKEEGIKENGRLFQITLKAFNKNLKIITNKVGIKDRNTSHMIRKTKVSTVYRKTQNLKLCQNLCNHSNPNTTLIYIQESQNRLDNAILETSLF